MKAASGVAHIAALLLVACATAQSVDSNGTPTGSVDAGRRRDSGSTQSAGGAATDNGGTGGEQPASSGGADEGSAGSATGGTVDSSGGAGGTSQGGATGGIPGTSSGGSSGSGGTTGNGGSTQSDAGKCSAGQKVCGGVCVTETPSNGCSATSCGACPIPAPANGLQICDAQGQCNFECLSGYQKNGAVCTKGTGGAGGGGGAGGSSGNGGAPSMCGNDTCHRCLGNLIGCCNKQGDRCMCVLPNLTDQCGP